MDPLTEAQLRIANARIQGDKRELRPAERAYAKLTRKPSPYQSFIAEWRDYLLAKLRPRPDKPAEPPTKKRSIPRSRA